MFNGIHAIAYALFDANEQLDRDAMRRQTEICLACGVDGMAALGLATEVSKLSGSERRTVMERVAADVAKRVPLAFTIYGNSVAEQVAQARHAASVGANWIILQPPAVGAYAGVEYIRFFGRIVDATSLPVAIWRAMQARHKAEAERLYSDVLPSIVFIMQSIESLICYGKRVFAARAGLTVHDRAPALRPTPLGLDLVDRHAARLGAYPVVAPARADTK